MWVRCSDKLKEISICEEKLEKVELARSVSFQKETSVGVVNVTSSLNENGDLYIGGW